ncbi:fimbrial protein [Enterobacter roggenkampii]|uniref:fimbrial protein n=1 Tax=Enterobacter asburiae TaxID=61645 RepID=UPI002002BEBA|nr:fimbrial protein [Enterobacter asburiae]MCK6788614.1 fimbrial protein [Enterobacter roggenkampii]MCM7836249.1 fimbrial protein [Enterobacter asburiae]
MKIFIIALLAIIVSATDAMADTSCVALTPQSNTVPLSATILSGADLPVGSVIYRLTITSNGFGLRCNGAMNNIPLLFSVSNEPSMPISVAGAPYNGAVVYPTNLPGVGAAVWYSGNAFTKAMPFRTSTFNFGSNGVTNTMYFSRNVDISLIKTGAISAGFVNGSSLPTIVLYTPETAGYTGLPLNYWTLKFSGVVGVTTGTCTTPNVNVDLGKHDLRTTFKGKGSTTEWVDSSIILEDCPAFLGYYPTNNPQKSSTTAETSGGTIPSGTATANNLIVSLTASTGIIDSANGIVALNNEDSGLSATGIGVQLGYKSIANPTIWNFSNSWIYSTTNDGASTIKLPLAARYYQYSDVVTPGKANSSVIFTISYQ